MSVRVEIRRRRERGARVRVRRSRLGELQLASTSDIAFLLLIFFLATAVFASQSGLAFLLPPLGSAPAPATEVEPLRVHVGADGTVIAEGTVRDRAGLVAWASAREGERPGRLFVVEVDARCRYEALVQALDALQEASVRQLSFRAWNGS